MYQNVAVEKIPLPNDIREEYNSYAEELDYDRVGDVTFTHEYFMPDEYKDIDLGKYLKSRCSNDEEWARCEEELQLFQMAGAEDFLKYLIYLKDTMVQKKIIWGVGRGSSVSLFSLYLIGIHKVDSIKYGLDYSDFFKIKE